MFMSLSGCGRLFEISTEKVGIDEGGGPDVDEDIGPAEPYDRLPLLAELGPPPLLRSGGLSALASEARERFNAPTRSK